MNKSQIVVLLNSPILTTHGYFKFRPVSVESAREMALSAERVISAIGHASTAEILSRLLGMNIEVNRIKYEQRPGEIALVFRLKTRPPEGVVLTLEELQLIGFEFGVLEMIESND